MRPIDSTISARRFRRRGAALYLTTVFVSLLLAGIAMSLIATQRADRRLQTNVTVENQSWWIARAGIDLGVSYLERVSNWRTQVTTGTLLSNVAIGAGTCTIELFDDRDNNLANDETQPVRLVSTATCNGATCKLQATLLPRPDPALTYACFGPTAGDMEFKSGSRIAGPVRSHGRIRASGSVSLLGNASFQTMSGQVIDSTLTPQSYSSASISIPALDPAWYRAGATPITGSTGTTCQLRGYNLTPTNNPVGTANANGIYSLDPGGRDVVIENMHLKGTLIIWNATAQKITFQKGLWVEPGTLGYPVLILDNPSADAVIAPTLANLTELTSNLYLVFGSLNYLASISVDFNEDGDALDAFTTSVRGTVWASSTRLFLQGSDWTFQGCAINQHLTTDDGVMVRDDVQLQNTLAPGLIGSGMRIVRGNFKDAP